MPQSENMLSSSSTRNKNDMQEDVEAFWNEEPCDSENSAAPDDSKEYYLEIESDRYLHQGHILEIFNWIDWKNKTLLEIGTGVGTDARKMISLGADYHGINVDKGSCEATKRALEIFGCDGQVQQMSATNMQFGDSFFDIVYSFGVLHHIPDVHKAISEIHRVLKPGGYLLFMVYNRSSINYQIEIRHLRRWALRLLMIPGVIPIFGKLGFPQDKLQRHVELFRSFGKMNEAEWLSRNTDGPDNPYSLVYGHHEIFDLLGDRFEILKNEVYYFDWRHWGVLGKILPAAVINWLGKHWGWHRIVLAKAQ